MEIYLVGGAIRDSLLGLPVSEKDWVVVGSTPEEMTKQGYQPVGKAFPVFLHPETKEEYALARTEKKVSKGYKGFEFKADPSVTLEEDLQRRDITINAIAQTEDGELIDPFEGQADLKACTLRHVSDAFVEDPVRILRIARFTARLSHLGFSVAEETMALMQEIVKSGEVDALVPERVWKEFEWALTEKNPEQFIQVLAECGALKKLFPELKDGAGTKALTQATEKSTEVLIRFASLAHTLKPKQLKTLSDRYKIPNDFRSLAKLVITHPIDELLAIDNAKAYNELFEKTDAYRRTERFEKFLSACDIIADVQASTDEMAQRIELLNKLLAAAKDIDTKSIIEQGFEGEEIRDEIKALRINAIEENLV